MKNNICLLATLFLLLNVQFDSYAQSLLVNTSIESGAHNYSFYEPLADSTTITVFATNTFQAGGPYEFRVYDHSFNMLKRKRFLVSNDSLTSMCGSGSTSVHTNAMRFYPKPADSCIYITTNFTHNYGTCPQLNGLVLMKCTNDFDTIWCRQYSALAVGSIPFNDSTLLFHGYNNLFKVRFSNGDTIWAKRSIIYTEGAFKSFTDTTIYVFGRGNIPGIPGYVSSIYELSESGNYTWCASLCDSLKSQYFVSGTITSDSCFAMLSIRDNNTTNSHLGLVKIDRLGNKLWEKIFTIPGNYLSPNKIFQTSDNGFLIAYYANTIGFNALLKLDSLGNVVWNKKFPGTNYACQTTFLGNIISLGNEKLLITGGNLIQTDTVGNGCFFQPYTNINVVNGASYMVINPPFTPPYIPLQQNVKYNIRSNKFSYLPGLENSYIDSCNFSTALYNSPENFPILLYPNPSSDKIFLETPESFTGSRFSIFDLLGKEVYSNYFNDKKTILDITETGSGVFILRIENEGKSYFSKIVFSR